MKSIVRCIPENCAIHSPHDPKNSVHNKIPWNRCNTMGIHRERNGSSIGKKSEEYIRRCNNIAHIKHYFCKSFEEWVKYKTLRGRCDKMTNMNEYRYTVFKYFWYNKYDPSKKDQINEIKKKYNIDYNAIACIDNTLLDSHNKKNP